MCVRWSTEESYTETRRPRAFFIGSFPMTPRTIPTWLYLCELIWPVDEQLARFVVLVSWPKVHTNALLHLLADFCQANIIYVYLFLHAPALQHAWDGQEVIKSFNQKAKTQPIRRNLEGTLGFSMSHSPLLYSCDKDWNEKGEKASRATAGRKKYDDNAAEKCRNGAPKSPIFESFWLGLDRAEMPGVYLLSPYSQRRESLRYNISCFLSLSVAVDVLQIVFIQWMT